MMSDQMELASEHSDQVFEMETKIGDVDISVKYCYGERSGIIECNLFDANNRYIGKVLFSKTKTYEKSQSINISRSADPNWFGLVKGNFETLKSTLLKNLEKQQKEADAEKRIIDAYENKSVEMQLQTEGGLLTFSIARSPEEPSEYLIFQNRIEIQGRVRTRGQGRRLTIEVFVSGAKLSHATLQSNQEKLIDAIHRANYVDRKSLQQ